jgi:hypothetical protein
MEKSGLKEMIVTRGDGILVGLVVADSVRSPQSGPRRQGVVTWRFRRAVAPPFAIMGSVDENERDAKSWAREAAELEEQWKQRAAAEVAWWKERSVGQQEILRQQNLMHGGMIAIGIVMVQPFLTATPEAFDLSARICVIAFSVAIPILAALVMVNSQETYRRRLTTSTFVQVARSAAFGSGFVGVAAGFWHMTPIAGVGITVAAAVAIAVQSIGYVRVERDDARTAPEGKDRPQGKDKPEGKDQETPDS